MNDYIDVWCLNVNCERNDRESIECGGSPLLGYTFYVPYGDNKVYKDKIMECIKKYNRPFISITSSFRKMNKKYISDLEKIEETIKNEIIA